MAASSSDFIPIPQGSTTAKIQSAFSSSPPASGSPSALVEDYIGSDKVRNPTLHFKSNSGLRFDLPHKWRPLCDYVQCTSEQLAKCGISLPEKGYHPFNLYIKKKDQDEENPTIYFIKFNTPGSYESEFEALFSYLHNLFEPGIIPSAHVVFDEKQQPVGVCTPFEKSFVPVKKKAVTEADLKLPSVFRSLSIILILGYLLEEYDLHANNFGWIIVNEMIQLMRVDAGKTLWNLQRLHPKLATYTKIWEWLAPSNIFPVKVDEIESAPNFKSTARYFPSPSSDKSSINLFNQSSTMQSWWSKNAFNSGDMDLYRKPENFQKNPEFKKIEYKLIMKYIFLADDIIKEYAGLFLRKKEGSVELKLDEGITAHLADRIAEFRAVLPQSKEFKAHMKMHGPESMNEILDERDRLKDAIEKKVKKNPLSRKAYGRLFEALDDERKEASMSESAVKGKFRQLKADAS